MAGYLSLFKKKGFQPFLWTQFLGAFNDNLYKIVLSLVAVNLSADPGVASRYLSLIGALFILPFFLFSGYAGHLADVYSKRRVLIFTKSFEIVAMSLGLFAFWSGEIQYMLGVLFLMAVQSTFFSPAKYGILPEMFPDKDLSLANGLLEMTTFMAIILGTAVGSALFALWKDRLEAISLAMIGIAVIGTAASLGISKVSASGAVKAFDVNPWGEIIVGIRRLYANKSLWIAVIGISYFWFLGALVQMDILLLGKEMGLDDLSTGLMVSYLAIGIGVGSMLTGRLSGNKVELGLVPIGSIGMGLFAIAVNLSTASYSATALSFVLLGGAAGFFIVPLHALLQQKSGKEEKGLLLATNNFLNTFGILLASGAIWLFHERLHLRADQVLLGFGLFTIAGTLYLCRIFPDFWVRFILWLLTHTIYKIRIEGEEYIPSRGPALLVCNQLSPVDGLLVGACIQRSVRFMVYKPYYEMKALHWLYKAMKAIPVVAGFRREILETLDRACTALREGHVVCLFTEGAIGRSGHLLSFKRGFEGIVKDLDCPIFPVHLGGLCDGIISFKAGKFFWKWPLQFPCRVTVSFGPPLPSYAKADEARSAIMELGSAAASLSKTSDDLLHLKFIRFAKKEWFRFCMADSSGIKLSYGQTLVSALLLSKKIRVLCPDQTLIGLMLPASVAGALANLAVLLAGKVPVNLNFTAGKSSVDSALRQCKIKTVLSSKTFLQNAKRDARPEMVYLEEISDTIGLVDTLYLAVAAFLLPSRLIIRGFSTEKQDRKALATIIFSSGSTGEPKGVMLSHQNILANVEAIAQVFWLIREDRVLGVLPFFHAFGFTGTFWLPLMSRCGAIYHPNPMDANGVGETARKYRASIMIGTPTFYNAYIRRCPPEAFASLRYAIVGAEKLRQETAESFKAKFHLDLLEGYGCTELSPVVAANIPTFETAPDRQHGHTFGTVGRPIPGVSIKIVDPETQEKVLPDEEGLLWVKGPNVMLGYLNLPEKTNEVIREGWYCTGDIASVDDEGFIRITDRLSRFSKIGGELVPHLRVEDEINRLIGSDAHKGCVVTAIPDPQKGERLVVFYSDRIKSAHALWSGLCQTTLPKLWIPKPEDFIVLDAIPTLGSGKTDLKRVKALALERRGSK